MDVTVVETGRGPIRKILQTGDLHVKGRDEAEDSLVEQESVLGWIADHVEEAGVDLVVIAGDLSGWTCPHRASDAERNAISRFIHDLRDAGALVIVLMGNHDIVDNWLWLSSGYGMPGDSAIDGVWLVTRPTTFTFDGDPALVGGKQAGVMVHAMPYPGKALLVPEFKGSKDDLEDALLSEIEGTMKAFGRCADGWGGRVWYTGHHGTRGVVMDSGQPSVGTHPDELPLAFLALTGASAGGMNHIHLAQPAGPFQHVGAPFQHTFGERALKYIGIWEARGDGWAFRQIRTPHTRRFAAEAKWVQTGEDLTDGEWRWVKDEGLVVPSEETFTDEDRLRVRLRFPSAMAAAFTNDAVAELTGCGRVTVERDAIREVEVRGDDVAKATTVPEAYTAWCEEEGEQVTPRGLELLNRIIMDAEVGS